MHFVAPHSFDGKLDAILSTSLDKNYPYWLGGAINWIVQSYLVLRQYREGITISTEPLSNAINIAHVTTWRALPRHENDYRVSIRADYRRLFDVDFEILQNPTAIRSLKQAYLTYWPVPRLQPRDITRKAVKNVAYAGRVGNRNIDDSLRNYEPDTSLKGLKFRVVDKQNWHDMREIDVLLAIRDFSTYTYDEKPPSKLLNAWHAGIPLIAGYDSAFSSIGTPGVDYIRVKTERELSDALARLQDDPKFYCGIVEAGRCKSQKYTRDKIAQTWLNTIEGKISTDFDTSKAKDTYQALFRKRNQFTDFAFNTVSSSKTTLRRLLAGS